MPLDPTLGPVLAQLAILTGKSTAAVVTRVDASKASDNKDEVINQLQGIINELIDERSQLQSIATALRDHIVGESLDGADIKYITDKLIPAVERIWELSRSEDSEEAAAGEEATESDPKQAETMEIIKQLVSPEILTVFQLMGFNYKRAIGEPLTRVVEHQITKDLPSEEMRRLQAAFLEREAAIAKVALNAKAVANFERLRVVED